MKSINDMRHEHCPIVFSENMLDSLFLNYGYVEERKYKKNPIPKKYEKTLILGLIRTLFVCRAYVLPEITEFLFLLSFLLVFFYKQKGFNNFQ